MLYNPRPRKEYAEEMPGRPVLINGYWHIEWTPARTGHQAITPYGWPTREQAERAIAAHKQKPRPLLAIVTREKDRTNIKPILNEQILQKR